GVQDDGARAGPFAQQLLERALQKGDVAKVELSVDAQDQQIVATLGVGKAQYVAIGFAAWQAAQHRHVRARAADQKPEQRGADAEGQPELRAERQGRGKAEQEQPKFAARNAPEAA